MKSYLDLVPISAKVHKKQNRMSIFCIILSVFLVTAIFGMADMFVRSQITQLQIEEGNWHIMIQNIGEEKVRMISARPEIKSSSSYGVLNYQGDLGYTLSSKKVIICGSDESLLTDMMDMIDEGSFPKGENEALVTKNAKNILDLHIGEEISISNPSGKKLKFTVSGFLKNTSKLMSEDTYGVFLDMDSFSSIYRMFENGNSNNYNSLYYFQFSNAVNIRQTIDDIKTQFELSDDQVSENKSYLDCLEKVEIFLCGRCMVLLLFYLFWL